MTPHVVRTRAAKSDMTPDSPVRDALAEHYRAHGLPADGGAADPWFRVRLGALSVRLPNPPARRRAVFLHDVNHLATGYNVTFGDGEIAIAAFEVGAGCGHFAIVWFINLCMLAIGLVLGPRTVFRAFRRGRHSISIYRDVPPREHLATMSIAAIRQHLGLDPAQRDAGRSDYVAFAGWACVAVGVLVAPVGLVLGAAWLGLRAWMR